MTTIQEMTSIENMAFIQQFVDYVDSFYGTDDPLYPMMSRETILLYDYNYKFVGE